MCLVQYLQIHLNSFISGFTFVFTLVIELAFLNVAEAIFLNLLKIMNWIQFYFSDIGIHFEVVEFSSPIKRINGNQIVNRRKKNSITRTHLTDLNHLKSFLGSYFNNFVLIGLISFLLTIISTIYSIYKKSTDEICSRKLSRINANLVLINENSDSIWSTYYYWLPMQRRGPILIN